MLIAFEVTWVLSRIDSTKVFLWMRILGRYINDESASNPKAALFTLTWEIQKLVLFIANNSMNENHNKKLMK